MTTQNNPQREKPSVTAQISTDSMGLGRTSGQRTAEMVAGMRYELDKTELNMALSRLAGRLVARMISALLRDKSQMNYILARPASFKQLTQQYVSKLSGSITLVEIAAGFSPRGVEFAREMPQVNVIEIDLPDVVAEKQRRLAHATGVDVPPNIKWYGADLGVESLADVLGGQKVDIVSAEGLNPYFTPEDITRIASHVRESLKPGGIYISDIGWEETRQSTETSPMSFFNRQASTFLGVIKSDEEGVKILADAGYTNIEVYRPTLITANMPDIPTTPRDYSVIFVAQNPVDAEAQPEATTDEEIKVETSDTQADVSDTQLEAQVEAVKTDVSNTQVEEGTTATDDTNVEDVTPPAENDEGQKPVSDA